MSTEISPITNPGRDDAAWITVALLLVPLALFQLADPFSVDVRSTFPVILFTAILGGAAFLYRRIRPDPALRAMVTGLQQMILFSVFGSVLSYMIAARGGPLWDARLQSWDQALGLDWRAYLNFANAHPGIATAYRFAYMSLMPQIIVLIVGLGFARKVLELRIAVLAAIVSGTVAICLSGLTPAMGNFVFLGLGPHDYPNLHPSAAFVHVEHLNGLRSGSLRALSLSTMQGIITFPSYHAALATVFAWGFLRTPILRWPGFIVATLTILATPVDGGHYFVDVFAGIAIAAASIWAARRMILFQIPALAPRLPVPEGLDPVRALPFRRSRGSSAL